MRQAINENRYVQLALLGVLALVGGLFLMKSKGGGEEATTTTPPATTGVATTTGTDAAAAGATTGASLTTADTATTGTTGAPAATLPVAAPVPVEMVPGPGLPRDLLAAYGRGEAVVLLVVRGGGIDDRLVRRSVEKLRSDPTLAVYVTKAREIARYAWLTQGANVTHLPALVVLSPRAVSGDTPTATVSYGFRGPPSVVQAVRDALYAGPAATYHP
jgi:hypothetical protein